MIDRVARIQELKAELKELTDAIKAEAAALKAPRKARAKSQLDPTREEAEEAPNA